MQLFYTPGPIAPTHTLGEEESRHAVKVLRLGRGERLHITDGAGNLYLAEVTDPDPRGCKVRIVETLPDHSRRPYRLTMAVAPTKNADRYEWFLEKATEVGLDAVIPIECDNSERRVFNSARAQKVVTSAMKQSLKSTLPTLERLTPLREVIRRPWAGLKLIAHLRPPEETPDHPPVPITGVLADLPSEVVVLIGPEGDFSSEEVSLALREGFIPTSLGESRLRTETAALAAVMATYFANLRLR